MRGFHGLLSTLDVERKHDDGRSAAGNCDLPDRVIYVCALLAGGQVSYAFRCGVILITKDPLSDRIQVSKVA